MSQRVVASALTASLAAVPLAVVPTAQAAPAAAAPTVQVSIGQHRVVHMPTRLRPGVHRFAIRSAKSSAFQLLAPRRGYTKREAVRDVTRALITEQTNIRALRRFERNTQLAGGVSSAPGAPGVMWARLHPGRYWAVDTNLMKLAPRKLHTVDVRGQRVAGALPAGPTLRAVDEAKCAPKPATIPARGVLRFVNDSTDNHFIAMGKLLPGKTVDDFAAWVKATKNGQNVPPPFDESNPGLDSGALDPGTAMAMRYHVSPGNYVLTCFWPDADMGGLPHAFVGMYRGITVE
jgi:hypothetical protein